VKLYDIKILTDENISPKVVKFIKEQGIDVLDTKEQNWHGKEDEELLKIAFRERRFILTHDSDFGTLAINGRKEYYGFIYFRLKNVNPRNIIKICKHLLNLNPEIFPGSILVVEEARVRIRHPYKDEESISKKQPIDK